MSTTTIAAQMANAVHAHSHRVSQHNDTTWGELGAITSSGDLQLAQSGMIIPQGHFLVAKHLLQYTTQEALNNPDVIISGTDLAHAHMLPPLSPGDQVVVVWVDGGTRAVIVAAV